MPVAYRIEIVGRNVSGVATTFHFGTYGFTASPAHPRIPNQYVAGVVTQTLLFRRDLYGEGNTYGSPEIAHGDCQLRNDGRLDFLLDYGFDGQTFRVYKTDTNDFNTETLVFDGYCESFVMDEKIAKLLVRDKTYEFDVALQPTKYAGNNVLPDGLEGVSDLAGKPKPVLTGVVTNASPPCVNTTRFIYQIKDDQYTGTSGVGSGGLSVYDKGVSIPAGIARTLTEMQTGSTSLTPSLVDPATNQMTFAAAHGLATATPVHVASTTTMPGGLLTTQYYYARAVSTTVISFHPTAADATANTNVVDITSAGTGTITVATNRTPQNMFDWCYDTAGSYFRLGLKPDGMVTFDAVHVPAFISLFPYPEELAIDLARRVNSSYALDLRMSPQNARSSNHGGFWATEETTVYDAISKVLTARNASFQIYTNQGTGTYLTVNRLDVPVTSVLDLTTRHIISLARIQPRDALRGIPAWRVNSGYGPNQTVQRPSDLATSLSLDTIARLGKPERTIGAENAAVKNRFPLAPELNFHTTSIVGGGAVSLNTYVQGVYFILADLIEVVVKKTVFDAIITNTPANPIVPGPMLNMCVKVTWPRFNFNSGRLCSIVGYEVDYEADRYKLLLWSARP